MSGGRQAYENERQKVGKLFHSAANGDETEFREACGNDGKMILGYKDGNGRNALHFASYMGRLNIVKVILGFFESKEEIGTVLSVVDNNGDGPLSLAVRMGHAEVAKYLFENGGNFTVQGSGESKEELKEKMTLLHESASSGDPELVRMVIEDFKLGHLINVRSQVGTPLFWAAFNANGNIAKLLLDHGADPNVVDNDGVSILLVATTTNAADVVKPLIEAGAKLKASTKQEGETTVLHAGAASGATQAIETILECGNQEEIKEYLEFKCNGFTPVELAAYAGHRELAKILLEKYNRSKLVLEDICEQMAKTRVQDEIDSQNIYDQGIEECQKKKDEGNALFVQDKFQQALDQYALSINHAKNVIKELEKENNRLQSEKSSSLLEGFKLKVLVPLLNNNSSCYLKLNQPEKAKQDAQKSLDIDKKLPKAYYRLGLACSQLKEYADAAQAFYQGYELDPQSKTGKAMFTLFQKQIELAKQQKNQQKS